MSNQLATKCPLYEMINTQYSVNRLVQTASFLKLWLTLLLEIPNELFSHCVPILQHGFKFREAASRTVLSQILYEVNITTFPTA